ncbi:ADP-ribose pyrophosphatase, mitochondrial [Phlebotomus argentipes]|uniref:ADP-ribose pyrophosphatase, mitochondrial n=1 Tax=Phlebotomus argentipes TaxID=94469 RepID=UPI00289374D9|nr:ADP-ribose pyrophosphatase, mitochondrial [Phlebotomus argentipes]
MFKGSLVNKFQPMKRIMHRQCRNSLYPGTDIMRCTVDDPSQCWSRSCPDYEPRFYESPRLEGKPWADPAFGTEEYKKIQFNTLDGNVNRKSYGGEYQLHDGLPRNPVGRTGIAGRGLLGRWGPNHAADPIVTRWKRDENGAVMKHPETGSKFLQMCVIMRKDCGKWAIPGGMVDPGENIAATLKREFIEEALNSNARPTEVEIFFKLAGTPVYEGYVDDPRNTDNAWMETLAMNFHDKNGDLVGRFPLEAGSDAARVKWKDVDRNIDLYANHSRMVKLVAEGLKAHW